MTTAILDTTHVTRTERGDFLPAPRRAYAMVHVAYAVWGSRLSDEGWENFVVGVDHVGPIPVFVPAGKRINQCVGYSPACGDEIVQALAITREDYIEAIRRERQAEVAAERLESSEF